LLSEIRDIGIQVVFVVFNYFRPIFRLRMHRNLLAAGLCVPPTLAGFKVWLPGKWKQGRKTKKGRKEVRRMDTSMFLKFGCDPWL